MDTLLSKSIVSPWSSHSPTPSCMHVVIRRTTGKLYMYDQRPERPVRVCVTCQRLCATSGPHLYFLADPLAKLCGQRIFCFEMVWGGGQQKGQNTKGEGKGTKGPKPHRWKRRWVPNGSAAPTQCWTTVPPVSCCYALLFNVAVCRSTMLVVETEVLCSVAQRKRVGQFFFCWVTARGKCDE